MSVRVLIVDDSKLARMAVARTDLRRGAARKSGAVPPRAASFRAASRAMGAPGARSGPSSVDPKKPSGADSAFAQAGASRAIAAQMSAVSRDGGTRTGGATVSAEAGNSPLAR